MIYNVVLVQVYSKVIQLHICKYPFFFRFFAHVVYYRALSGVSCTMQWLPSCVNVCHNWASRAVLVVKNPPANAGDLRDRLSIPGLGLPWRRGVKTIGRKRPCKRKIRAKGNKHGLYLGDQMGRTW